MARRILALVLALAVPAGAAYAQQVPDPAFDTSIARPMFTRRHPQLLVDQGHHNTHTTRSRYDVVAKLAIADGFEVTTDDNRFATADLKGIDVLLIANALGSDHLQTATAAGPAFTAQECRDLRAWIAAGGSLLFVAEHPPMGTAAKPLARALGVDFSEGYLVDPVLADTSFGASTLVFSDATRSLGDHPILRGRGAGEQVRRVRTYTGQSLAGPPGSVALLKVTARAQDYMLGPTGVRGPVPDSLKRRAAGRAQAIAFTLGKGRVVVLGETSMLCAQLVTGPNGTQRKVGMNADDDNRQFAINTLRWLAHGLDAPAVVPVRPAPKAAARH